MEQKKKILFYTDSGYNDLVLRRQILVKLGSQIELVSPKDYVKGEHYDGAVIHTGMDGAATVLLDLLKNFPSMPISLDQDQFTRDSDFSEAMKKVMNWKTEPPNISVKSIATPYLQEFTTLLKRINSLQNGANKWRAVHSVPDEHVRAMMRESLVGVGYQPEPLNAKPEVQARIDAQLNKWKIQRERKLARGKSKVVSRHLV